MPLIMLSGYPASGKTVRANQIKDYFLTKIAELSPSQPKVARLKVHLVNDEGLGISKEVYREARPEKDARATFYGTIKRFMSRDDIVIADGMNYIKGYRYQLYCEAKELMTPSCVVQIGASPDKCRQWNKNDSLVIKSSNGEVTTSKREGYADDVLENLIFRFEEPNGMTRWDSPLFVVPDFDETVPGEAIWDAIVNAGVVRPNLATVVKPAAETNYLQILDKTTQEIVALMIEHQKLNGEGGEVKVPEASIVIELPPSQVTVGQLQRYRRQFIALNRQNTYEKSRLRDLFVEYLNSNMT